MLAGLAGRWSGQGFNLISLPDFDSTPPSTGNKPFRTLLSATHETLEFTPIGANVPNRGSQLQGSATAGQRDIAIFGLRYLQRVNNADSHEPLHIENGFWLNVPTSAIPQENASVVRQGSIPHGSTILAQGTAFPSSTGKPVFAALDSTPQRNPQGAPLSDTYLAPLAQASLPPRITNKEAVKNPNVVLAEAIQPFADHLKGTTVLSISSKTTGGVLNIPFLQNATNNNAAATAIEATFWIETVEPDAGHSFEVLQYSQTVTLNFLGIDWPHISVATLFRQ
ncbi:MAG TPA: heme-binding protein [Paraburkholderia sp.]